MLLMLPPHDHQDHGLSRHRRYEIQDNNYLLQTEGSLRGTSLPVAQEYSHPQCSPNLEEVPLPTKLVEDHREASESRNLMSAKHLEEQTTMMVRNIPDRFSVERAMLLWPPTEWHYNFIFVPYRPKQRRSSRYAFLNFETSEHAVNFRNRWHGTILPTSASTLFVAIANVQGLEANLEMHRDNAQQGSQGARIIVGGTAVPVSALTDLTGDGLQGGLCFCSL